MPSQLRPAGWQSAGGGTGGWHPCGAGRLGKGKGLLGKGCWKTVVWGGLRWQGRGSGAWGVRVPEHWAGFCCVVPCCFRFLGSNCTTTMQLGPIKQHLYRLAACAPLLPHRLLVLRVQQSLQCSSERDKRTLEVMMHTHQTPCRQEKLTYCCPLHYVDDHHPVQPRDVPGGCCPHSQRAAHAVTH